jgi:hypothetical protein
MKNIFNTHGEVIFRMIILIMFLVGAYDYFFLDSAEGVNQAFIGGIIRGFGARKQKKRLEDDLKNKGNIGNRIDEINKFRPNFSVDRSGFDAFTDALSKEVGFADSELGRAKFNSITAGGRPEGDRQARESIQKSTANVIDNASQSVNDAGSLGAILGLAAQQENNALNNVDIQSSQRIEQNKRFAEDSRSQAASRRQQAGMAQAQGIFGVTQANQDLDIMEYEQNQLNPWLQATSDQRQDQNALFNARNVNIEAWAGLADGFFNNMAKKKDQALSLITGGLGG